MTTNALPRQALAAVLPALVAPVAGSTLSVIDKNISYIRTTGKNVQERIQDTAVMIIAHANEHGDCSRALTLVTAMPKGLRRSLVVKFFGMFSPIAVNVNDRDARKNSVRLRKSDSTHYNAFNVGGARAVPWYTIEPEHMPDTSWDAEKVNATVINMADRLQKRLDNNLIDADAVDRTIALVAALKAA